MLFSKEHLSGYYQWSPEPTNSLYTGSPSRRLFDRWNGDQVLFVINSLATASDKFTVEDGKNAENLLINKLPLNTHSELSVFNWLKEEISKLSTQVTA